MLTQEEVKIRLGVDASQVGPQMSRLDQAFTQSIDRTVNKSLKSLRRLLTFNLTGMALGFGSQILGELEDLYAAALPWRQEFWDRVFGVDPASSASLEKSVANMKRIRRELETSLESLAKLRRDNSFEDADTLQKIAMLEEEGGKLMLENTRILATYRANLRDVAEARTILAKTPPPVDTMTVSSRGPGGAVTVETPESKARREAYAAEQAAAQRRVEIGIANNAGLETQAAKNEAEMIRKGRSVGGLYGKIGAERDKALEGYGKIPVEGIRLPQLTDARAEAALEAYRHAGQYNKGMAELADQIAARLQNLPVVIKSIDE